MIERDRIIVTSGSFDPLSLEELNFLKKCRKKGDWLVVGIHSDWWMNWSQGGFVQSYNTRREILSNIRCVDEIFTFNDNDGTITQLCCINKSAIKSSIDILQIYNKRSLFLTIFIRDFSQ